MDRENLAAKLMKFREDLRVTCPSFYGKSVEGDCYANLLLRAAWALELTVRAHEEIPFLLETPDHG